MVHQTKTFVQFWTDMRGVDAWQTIVAKIFLIIEMLWTTVAVSFLLVNYYMKSYAVFPAADELSAFLLVIAHLGASTTIVHLVKKLQHGRAPVWFDAWWLVLCICLDLRSTLESRKGIFLAGETGDYLLWMGIIAVVLSGLTLVLFIIVKNTTINQGGVDTSGSPIPPARDDTNAAIMESIYNGNSSPAGVVSVRFPTTAGSAATKFVHQPARKGD